MISVAEALGRSLALVSPLAVEEVPLRHALGRYMPEPATATRNQPPFDASAMDGYAVQGNPAEGDSFTVVGEAGAGHGWAGTLGPNEACRIFTGAPLPAGATRVVIQEDVIRSGDRITLRPNADVGPHIRPAGQDFRAGDQLSPRMLTANDLALLASMNIPMVRVTRRPVVAIIATGDELVMPGEVPGPDQIIVSNSFALMALCESLGAKVRLLPIARDNEASLRTVFGLAGDADLILTTGGASVGDHDLVGQVAIDLGMEQSFWKIAMRPGKPLMAGRLGGRAMLGLPGNPVSSIVCAHLFALPMIRRMLGIAAENAGPAPLRARLTEAIAANGPRTHYMRSSLTPTADGLPLITPDKRQDSSLLSVLARSGALLIHPANAEAVPAGTVVDYLPL